MELNYGYNTPQDQQWNVYPAPSGSSEMLEPQEGLFPDLNPDDFAPPTDGHMQGDFMFETGAENDMANLNTASLKMLLAPPHPHLNPSGSELTELREQSGQPYLVQDDLTRQRQMDMQGRVTSIDNAARSSEGVMNYGFAVQGGEFVAQGGYQRVSTGIMASSGPQRSSAQSRGAKDNTDRPTSASTKRGQYAAVPKTTKTTKPKRRVGNKADQPQQIIFESVPSKADDLIDARASLSSWEEQYPAWYGVLECLIRTEHVEEWKLPLGVVTPNRADESLVEARIWYGERNPLPLASDPIPDIFYYAKSAQNWAHTADIRKAQNIVCPPPQSKPNAHQGFWFGDRLTPFRGVYNMLLAQRFVQLNTEASVKGLLRRVIDDPLNDKFALLFIEVMCCILGGPTALDPEARPFCLHFFKQGKVEPYAVTYSLLVCHHIGHFYTSGTSRTAPTFSRANYAETVEMMKRVVTSFEKDAGFVRFLVTVYDFLAKGNSE